MGNGKKILNTIFSKLPISEEIKHKAHVAWAEYKINKEEKQDQNSVFQIQADNTVLKEYVENIFASYGKRMPEYCEWEEHQQVSSKYHLSAYYLTQFHPNLNILVR